MAKKNDAKPGSRKTVTIDLDKLRKAIDELAPGVRHVESLERAISEGEARMGGHEMGLVREMTLSMDTVLGFGEADKLRQTVNNMIAVWSLLKSKAGDDDFNFKVSSRDMKSLAEDALEKLLYARFLLNDGRLKKGVKPGPLAAAKGA
ncbi:MAG: hypothetical protein QY316_06325 [Thermodesulfobacteriota bacterium]|nr:MAG: hypothetical protein QY316_06325 [Thermodesulfobacteriota bacterium]